MNEIKLSGRLINAQQLLEALFEPECRPSVRWLWRQTKNRTIPYLKIGHLVFFDLEMVRRALANQRTVRGRFLRD